MTPSQPSEDPDPDFVSLADAAQMFQVPRRTLETHVRTGTVPAHKVKGPRGLEWRVAASSLDSLGIPRRTSDPHPDNADELRRRVTRLERALAFERRRLADAQRQLGEAALTIAQLRQRHQRGGGA